MYLIEINANQIQGLLDVISGTPLPILLIALGILFLVLGAAMRLEWLGFKYEGRSAWIGGVGVVLLAIGLIVQSQIIEHAGDTIQDGNSKKAEILSKSAQGLIRVQDYQKATQELRKLIKLQPRDAWAWNQLSFSLLRQNSFEEALEANQEALKINQDYSKAWLSRALILAEKAKMTKGIQEIERTQQGGSSILYCIEQAIQSNNIWEDSSLASAWYTKGILLEMLERNQEAKEAFINVAKIDPGIKIPNDVRQRNGMPLQNENNANQAVFDTRAIHDKINQGSVSFSNGNKSFRGRIVESEIRERQILEESGVSARIKWNDDVISSILFMRNSRVRIWSNGQEYKGSWYWNSDGLISVKMDSGSKYQFGR